jgi:hypothetical protein
MFFNLIIPFIAGRRGRRLVCLNMIEMLSIPSFHLKTGSPSASPSSPTSPLPPLLFHLHLRRSSGGGEVDLGPLAPDLLGATPVGPTPHGLVVVPPPLHLRHLPDGGVVDPSPLAPDLPAQAS